MKPALIGPPTAIMFSETAVSKKRWRAGLGDVSLPESRVGRERPIEGPKPWSVPDFAETVVCPRFRESFLISLKL